MFIISLSNKAKAQEMNLPAYDHTYLHFGFILAINTTNFFVQPISDLGAHFKDSLKTIYSDPQTGFNLGIVSEIKIGPYLKLRFVPDLAFSERDLAYSFQGTVDTMTVLKRVESTFLDFPVDIKLISKRLTNFQAYILAGAKYVTDLSSQSSVNQQLAGVNATVRLIRNDYAYEAGAGLQFFLPYFKFGIEMKLSMGVRNLLVRDTSVYTESLETLRSKVFLISFCFEG
ncbi:MAG TPA: outer membrane beta-barrel protein [Bacteroidia bacterium]|nr:outer membrane beta-barrel protein [Bacteroidia bacterium]